MSSVVGDAASVSCPICDHTTPRGVVCLSCQPTPEIHRCQICERRGPRPAEDSTYSLEVGGVSIRGRAKFSCDDHTMTITVSYRHLDRSARRELVDRLAGAIDKEIKAAEGG